MLYNIVVVLSYINMDQPQVHMCPPIMNPLFHLFPHPTPLGCPRTPALSALLHASTLHWLSILHMVIYMFQCYSLKSSHPRLLPRSPKVCFLHLHLFCCLAYRIIITVFVNSTYVHSVQFSHSAVSDSLRPHESQHARPPCPSPTLKCVIFYYYYYYF